ncbi:TRAP transporter large permease [Gallibacterium salpingitidis]|uniref:TRAP transporter large permease protein n=1 Tax=Gallibacterium salpingitidis TaxID=505341 RepID=A0A1A7NZ45_9PAST|nr:TRAP transporter large permease [Gallibacterium salpingitidis]OBW95477.1 C4-dicarboxylate ABC transporter permease [Gallibacterium salpingitidis]
MLTLIGFFVALFIGVPIFISLLLASIIFMVENGNQLLLSSITIQMDGVLNQSGLLAIPLFMLVGELMNKGGLTKKLIACADLFVGGFRGGLAYVNLFTNAMAASILGSATAQISIMSKLMIPTMVEKGYDKNFSAAVTIAGGLLSPIIPPSMLMIIYSVIAYQPVAVLFLAGTLPGFLIIFSFALVIMIIGLVKGLPKDGGYATHESPKADFIGGLLPGCIPLSIIILILSGVMTPTEAGAVASVLSFAIGSFVYKELKFSDLPGILVRVAKSTAVITGLIAAASVFGWSLTFEGIPDQIVTFMASLTESKIVFLMLIYLLVILLGMFLESISVMIVIVPLLLPVLKTFGIDPIHFGVMISLATLVGLVTPPVGPGLFIAMAIAKLQIIPLFRAILPFLFAMLVSMILIAFIPELSLWLPSVFLK